MKKFRLYYDKDAEEVWLQQMSLQGWALKKFFLGVYTFVRCEPGEYIYRIDLLDNWSGDKQDYAAFMEEVGVEVVSQWWRWVYLRKKADDGPFELYSDIESQIDSYQKIMNFFRAALLFMVVCFGYELFIAIYYSNFFIGGLATIIGAFCLVLLRMIWKCQWKIEQLEKSLK